MKIKNPTTGLWEDICLKSTDTMPIGSIVEYDGNQVPSGWETVGDNITVITGTQTLTASETAGEYKQTVWSLDYPTGFTKDNCCVVAYMGSNGLSTTLGAYGVPMSTSMAMVTSLYPRLITFRDDKISVQAYNPATSSATFNYKIVLMKIN